MVEFFRQLFSSDFMPHGHCYFWQPEIVWLHAGSDAIIALSYYLIPLALVYFVRRRQDLAFSWMFVLFGTFILACGTTHAMGVWTLWHGTYRLDGLIKLITALVSLPTAFLLVRLIPQALALPSPQLLREANQALGDEVAERRKAEEELRRTRDELELRVEARTTELRRSEEQFRQLADSMPQIVWTARPDGVLDYYNRRWYDFTGLPEGIQGDESWKPILHPDDVEPCLETWYHSVRTGEPYEIEYRFRDRHTGSYRWFLGRALPVRDADGRIAKWYGSCTDIDQRKRAEEDLREADRRKNEFLAMLAHELRNPLSSINSAALLLDTPDGDDERPWAVDVIRRQVKHLGRLVDDLLDVARVTRGQIELRRRRLEVTPVFESAANTVRPMIDEKKQELVVSVDRGTLWCDADPIRLEQIVVNLLTNASKYTGNGGRIDLAARREGDDLAIRVRDTGMGIPPELLGHIFELFAQGERSLARSEGGLGIGLTLVKRLAEMHGGSVSVRSAGAGQGSEFVVRLPAAPSPETRAEPAPTQAPGGRKPGRILVVDDNVDTARALSRLLKLLGHEVRTAADGPSALIVARDFLPEVVLLDIGLPGLDGYEVARQLRADPCCGKALIIAVTGYGQEDDRRRSREAGFNHHLVKPINHDQLFALLSVPPHGDSARQMAGAP